MGTTSGFAGCSHDVRMMLALDSHYVRTMFAPGSHKIRKPNKHDKPNKPDKLNKPNKKNKPNDLTLSPFRPYLFTRYTLQVWIGANECSDEGTDESANGGPNENTDEIAE